MFDDIKFIQPVSDSENDYRVRYHLPTGSPLWSVIQAGKLNLEEKLQLAKDLVHIVLSFHKRKLLFYDLSWNLFWYDEIDQHLYVLDASMVAPTDHLDTRYNVFYGH